MKKNTMTKTLKVASIVLSAVGISSSTLAAPARLITSPPVVKTGNPLTGPAFDPLATQGQWFQNVSTGAHDFRPWEFYDNGDLPGALGGFAIRGQVGNLMFSSTAPGANMTGFNMRITITNDLGSPDAGLPGHNSHSEQLIQSPSYVGTMFDVKLTAEFALPSQVIVPLNVLNQIAANSAPYTLPDYGGGQSALMIAQNEDQEAWYCFTDGTGGFYVPTYDFGDIAVGQSVMRNVSIVFSGTGISAGHPLYPQMIAWATNQDDVLMNRTTDLKIGDWVDVFATDSGFPYPVPAFRSGNASVFFNIPEPTTLAMLVPVGLLALGRRHKSPPVASQSL